MKILITTQMWTLPHVVGISHYGVHLKRKLGGPVWWRYVNGVYLRLKSGTYWITFRRHERGQDKFITDRRKR